MAEIDGLVCLDGDRAAGDGPLGVLFDLDGTLIDTYDIILASFRHTVRTVLGRELPDEVLMQKVGQPLVTQMWDFTDDAAVHDQLVEAYRAHNDVIHDERVALFPGVADALGELAAMGCPLGVVTSKRSGLARRALELTGIDGRFAFVLGPDECPAHKPDPAPVAQGCAELGLDPSRCLYVGDSPFDMQAGNGAGCTTVAARWGMFPADVLDAERPDYALESIVGLPALVARLAAQR